MGVLILAGLLPCVMAQQSGQTGSTGNVGNPSKKDTPWPAIITPQQPGIQTPSQRLPQLVFLAGEVVTEDGSAPPFGGAIEMDCGGAITKETNILPNGRFSFQIGSDGRSGEIFPDASQRIEQSSNDTDVVFPRMSGNTGPSSTEQSSRRKRVIGCDLRAQLHGHRSTTLRLTMEPMPGPNELGTIVVYPIERVQGTLVSVSGMTVPKPARKSMDQAQKAVQRKNFPEAETLLKSAVKDYPKYAEAWFALGQLYEDQGRANDALEAFGEAITADRVFLKPYMRLAQLASRQQDWRKALDLSEQVLTLDPVTLPGAYYINALASLNLSDLDRAEKVAKHGQKLDMANRFPQFYLILANIFAIRDDTVSSMRELRNYLMAAPNSSNTSLVRSQLRKMEEQQKAGG